MKIGDKFKMLTIGRDITWGKIYEITSIQLYNNDANIYFLDDIGDDAYVQRHEISLIIDTNVKKLENDLKLAIESRDLEDIEYLAKALVNAIIQENTEPYNDPHQGDIWEFFDHAIDKPNNIL